MLIPPLKHGLSIVIWALMMTIFAAVIISWLRAFGARIPYYNPLIRAIEGTYETMTRPIRRAFPTTGGGFDFAPVVVLLLLTILQRIIASL